MTSDKYISCSPLSLHMQPFEQAWALLKMPIVPESIQHAGKDFAGVDEYTADFEHPETGEIYPMHGYVHDRETGTFIYPPGFKREKGDEWHTNQIGQAHFNADLTGEASKWSGHPNVSGRASEREPPVGMGSAMYDLAATMADKQGVKIVPSYGNRSNQARQMWAKHEDKGHWPPVRT